MRTIPEKPQGDRAVGGTRKVPIAAGVAVAAAAFAVTMTVMMSGPSNMTTPASKSQQAAETMKQCGVVPRKLQVSTVADGGVVRLRAGNYASPPIVLSSAPHMVVFPLPRPQDAPVEEQIVLEGNAKGVLITSDVTNLRIDLGTVSQSAAFTVLWAPMKIC